MPPVDPLIAHVQRVSALSEQRARNAREIRVQSHDHLRIKPCSSWRVVVGDVVVVREQARKKEKKCRVQSHDHLRIKPCSSWDQRISATAVPELTLLRKKSSDLASPSCKVTRGSQPNNTRAFVMSGQRRLGSSSGRARKRSSLFDSVTSRTACAHSRIVNSFGLPMFTGRCSSERERSRMPSIRSST